MNRRRRGRCCATEVLRELRQVRAQLENSEERIEPGAYVLEYYPGESGMFTVYVGTSLEGLIESVLNLTAEKPESATDSSSTTERNKDSTT